MKLSLNWAQNYSNVDFTKLSKDEWLTRIGQQLGGVDEVIEWGPRFDQIVIAKIISCEKHSNADKLSVCLIDDGGVVKNVKRDKNGLVQVVCGAPNVAAGQLVAWLPPGATVPSTIDKDPFVLEARELRGVVSNGMLASASELGISNDHTGILVIEPEEVGPVNPKRGTPLKNLFGLDDVVFDIENKMFTHRPDCFGILGLAREMAGITRQQFKSPAWYDEFAEIDSEVKALPLLVKNWSEAEVPRFSLGMVSDVRVGPSPAFMQAALTRVGIKPINNIVDVTNFVMHLTGQPIHAYDYDKVRGTKDSAEIAVRLSKKGENINLLGGKNIKLDDGAIVITDGNKPIGLAGIMGGADTEVDTSTKNIIVECANFDMNLIRKTSMVYGLFTDASTRFTKGQSPRQTISVLAYAVTQIKKYAGGKVAGKAIDLKSRRYTPIQVTIKDPKVIGQKLGLAGLTTPAIKHLLKNVEFKVTDSGSELIVEPPFWRTDIAITEDVVEEVGRLYGYGELPFELPKKSIKAAQSNQSIELKNRLRSLLAAAGANEVLTYSFIHSSLLEAAGQSARNTYHIKNALSPDLQYYRLTIAPSLLDKVHANVKQGIKDFAIYEIGSTHNRTILDKEGLPAELATLSLVITKDKISGAPYFWAKHYLEIILQDLNVADYELVSVDELKSNRFGQTAYQPSRAAYVKSVGKIIGIIGEPSTELISKLKLPANTAMFEIDLNVLMTLEKPTSYEILNRLPSIDQDLCLRTPGDISYAELTSFIDRALAKLGAKNGYNYRLQPIDVYKKDDSSELKQTTWRITLNHPERTLTTDEVSLVMDVISQETKDKFNAERV